MIRVKPRETAGGRGLRWYQFRLRTLLVLMLLASVAMGAVATTMRAAARQRDAVAEFCAAGGWVYYRDQLDADGSFLLELQNKPPGPPWLRKLLGDDFFRTVEQADVDSDAACKYLPQFDQLRIVVVREGVTDAGLEHLNELRQLRDLVLFNDGLTSAGFEHIAELTWLEHLSLRGTHTGDAELERLRPMAKLRHLGLEETKVTDAGLRHLEGLTSLEDLRLDKTQVGDAGVGRLKGLARLRKLGLSGTRISDAAVPCLVGFKQLSGLDVDNTNVSAEGVRKLERALPRCDVLSSKSSKPHDPFRSL
jgi:hypothetical protein